MQVAVGKQMVNYSGKDLHLYVFRANYNPIYGIEEPELTEIKMPALDEQHAWTRMAWLCGSKDVNLHFRLEEVMKYD